MPTNDSPYWNPKIETLPRVQLERLQLAKLQQLVQWADSRSEFHHRKFAAAGFRPEQLRTLDDVRRIPMTTKDEWIAAQQATPPFGNLLTAPTDRAVRFHLTSGTSGRTPLRVLDSARDWEWNAELWAYGLWAFGVRPTDVVYLAFSYGSFIGFWGAHYAAEKIGALTVASGNMSTEARVRQIVELGATTLCATPTYALRIGRVAREIGVDLARDANIERIVLGGEPGASIPGTRRQITELLGGRCGDFAGMTEIGTCMVVECDHAPGGPHIIEDHIFDEVLDPDTDEPVGYAERGERVVTSFGRGIIPLIRYRAGDLVERVPHDTCTCGRSFDLYRGGILGRADDMKLIRGTNVFPAAVEAIVREHDVVDEFRIIIEHIDGRDEVIVEIELHPHVGGDAAERVRSKLADDLAEHHEGLRFQVIHANPGSLPRFELKARRLDDRRHLTTGVGS